MTVELWYGRRPRSESEQNSWVELYQYLLPQEDHFVLLFNFQLGNGDPLSLIALKENAIFLGQLEHVTVPVRGGCEGDWVALTADGEGEILHPRRSNPFEQAQACYQAWKDWYRTFASEVSADVLRPWPVDYANVMTYIVLCPELPRGSHLNIGEYPVQAIGLREFMTSLLVRSSNRIGLSGREMCRIPRLLELNRWELAASAATEDDIDRTAELHDWQPAPFTVLVARGHNLSTAVFGLDRLDEDTIAVGRDPGNDLVISHQAVSRRHALVTRAEGRFLVRDLGSTSGTFVSYDGDPMNETDITGRANVLQDGSLIRFGPASYTFLHYE